MVNVPKKNLSPHLGGKYDKWTLQSTESCSQANDGKSSLEAETVWALRALRCIQSETNRAADNLRETHNLSNEEKAKWIEDYVNRGSVITRITGEDAETTMMQQHENMTDDDQAGLTTWKRDEIFEEMLTAIGDRLNDLASYDDEEDGEDDKPDE